MSHKGFQRFLYYVFPKRCAQLCELMWITVRKLWIKPFGSISTLILAQIHTKTAQFDHPNSYFCWWEEKGNLILRPSNRWEKMEKLYSKLPLVGENGRRSSLFTVLSSRLMLRSPRTRFSGSAFRAKTFWREKMVVTWQKRTAGFYELVVRSGGNFREVIPWW